MLAGLGVSVYSYVITDAACVKLTVTFLPPSFMVITTLPVLCAAFGFSAAWILYPPETDAEVNPVPVTFADVPTFTGVPDGLPFITVCLVEVTVNFLVSPVFTNESEVGFTVRL